MVRAMARNRTVGRQAAQSRPEASPPANVHAEYKAMLKGDFGDATFRPTDLEDGQPGGAASLFGRPTGLFLIACVAFVVVLCAKLYRDGALDHFWKQEPAAAPIDRSWVLGDRMRLPDSDVVRDEDEALEPAAPSTAENGKSTDKKAVVEP
jgi:hypothetical protein